MTTCSGRWGGRSSMHHADTHHTRDDTTNQQPFFNMPHGGGCAVTGRVGWPYGEPLWRELVWRVLIATSTGRARVRASRIILPDARRAHSLHPRLSWDRCPTG